MQVGLRGLSWLFGAQCCLAVLAALRLLEKELGVLVWRFWFAFERVISLEKTGFFERKLVATRQPLLHY